MSIFSPQKWFGDERRRALKKYKPLVDKVASFEADVSALSPEDLLEKTAEFKKRLSDGAALDDILPEAFAVVRETAKRTLGERHYDVQIIGGAILHEGSIAEMKTGEGKTLASTLPVYLNALPGLGVHVVTVNDYLSRRDAQWMGQIYAALGLSVGVINNDASYLYDEAHIENEEELDEDRDETGSFKIHYEYLRPCTRKEAYAADITYGTNNEFGFDYLRDNIAYDTENVSQRGFHFAIVDEIDSILIDEARTPLIISAPAEESGSLYTDFARIADALTPEEDYTTDEKLKAIQLTDSGIEKAEKALGIDNIYTEKGIKYVHHLETAVRAKALFNKDKEYVVRDGQIVIVDEFTGRLQPGRRWSEGLHQAIEAKEGAPIQKESRTVASITFQNYFRGYTKLSGMTGTALTSQEEFHKVYNLDVVPVPTHRPVARIDKNDLIFQTEKGKLQALTRHVKELNEKGQPVLIGTVSVEKNELVADSLQRAGVPFEVLNAKNHEREGEIIAQAGRKGVVTVATNMAGRGVDVKLGGNPASKEAHEDVKNLGGLFVLGTERHEARRIDNQLRGRSGRQGDPGETQFFVSLEDTLMRVFASDTIKNMMGRFGIPEDEPIENKMITRSLESAQTKIEGFNFDARKNVLAYDDVLNHQRETVYTRRSGLLMGEQDKLEELLEEVIAFDEAQQGLSLRNEVPHQPVQGEVEKGETLRSEGGEATGKGEALGEGLRQKIEQKKESLGEGAFRQGFRRLALQTTDMLWMEHLETMDYLRSSVNLRAYGQRDPLIEYRKEGLRLFHEMQDSIKIHLIEHIPHMGAGAFVREQQNLREHAPREAQQGLSLRSGEGSQTSRSAGGVGRGLTSNGASSPQAPIKNTEKIGRNDPCPCGATNPNTGKVYKYKQCGLINAPHHKS